MKRLSSSGSKSQSTRLAVVGAGPGGYTAAFLAADLGLEVTLIDPSPDPGGVCLYRGCIPSKALLHVAGLIEEARRAADWGVEFSEPRIDLERLRGFKDRVVKKLTGGLGQLVKQRKVRHLRGRARLLGANELEVASDSGDEQVLRFEHAILATGSRPATPPGFPPSSARIWDSTSALELVQIPGSLLIVGGGYIGLELGSVYAALGSRVSVVEMMPTLLPGVDADLVRPLARKLAGAFESIRLETTVATIEEQRNGVKVTLKDKDGASSDERFDRVLVSVGRLPNSGDLGLDRTRIEIDDSGFVVVDQQLRTAAPLIHAIGDLVGQPMLAHKASHEARVAVEAIAGHKVVFHPAAIPAVVFTDPEVAWWGLTEAAARAAGREVRVARFPWAASGRAATIDRDDGLTKLVIDPGTERVLGVGICGPGAGELIAEGVLAVEMAALAGDLRLTIHPHPTRSETIMEAAEVFFGQSTHIYRPRRR